MHSAPSVSYPVGRSRFGLVIIAAAWFAGCAGIGLWLAQSRQTGWQAALACALAFASGAWAVFSWTRSARGRLAWDGSRWTWFAEKGTAAGGAEPEAEVRIVIGFDAQRQLLLRLDRASIKETGAAAVWAWLECASDPPRWNDLRRAVYSRAKPDTLPGASGPQAAKP